MLLQIIRLSAYQISFYKYTELDLEINMNVFLIPSESIFWVFSTNAALDSI